MSTTKHTAGPWKVMAHPLLGEKHHFHKSRFITTADAVVEIYDADPDVRNQNDWDTAWGLRNGVIICETKDSINQQANARLIAAAPETAKQRDELLALLIRMEKAHSDLLADRGCGEIYPSPISEERFEEIIRDGEAARAAIHAATEGTP